MLWLTILRSPVARYIGIFLAVAGLAWWAYISVDGRGYARCERAYQLASAEAEAEAHQRYMQEVARGDAIQAKLIETQRRLNDVKTEYLAFANGITGNCPADLGLLINAAVQNGGLPQASTRPADPTATIAAALIARNIAENYGRGNACIAQLNALIDWHTLEKDLK